MDKLPYKAKELINLFALNTFKDYEALCEFNKIADYKPCKYSNEKLLLACKKKANIRRHDEKESRRKFVIDACFHYMNMLMYEYIDYFNNVFFEYNHIGYKPGPTLEIENPYRRECIELLNYNIYNRCGRRVVNPFWCEGISKWFGEHENVHSFYGLFKYYKKLEKNGEELHRWVGNTGKVAYALKEHIDDIEKHGAGAVIFVRDKRIYWGGKMCYATPPRLMEHDGIERTFIQAFFHALY